MELEERHVGQVRLEMGGLGMGGGLFRVSQHPHLADEETEEENARLSYTCTSDYTGALRAVGTASCSSPQDASLASCFLLSTLLYQWLLDDCLVEAWFLENSTAFNVRSVPAL